MTLSSPCGSVSLSHARLLTRWRLFAIAPNECFRPRRPSSGCLRPPRSTNAKTLRERQSTRRSEAKPHWMIGSSVSRGSTIRRSAYFQRDLCAAKVRTSLRRRRIWYRAGGRAANHGLAIGAGRIVSLVTLEYICVEIPRHQHERVEFLCTDEWPFHGRRRLTAAEVHQMEVSSLNVVSFWIIDTGQTVGLIRFSISPTSARARRSSIFELPVGIEATATARRLCDGSRNICSRPTRNRTGSRPTPATTTRPCRQSCLCALTPIEEPGNAGRAVGR